MRKHQLREYAEQAREQRLSGPHTNDHGPPLVGKCFDNALVLYNILKETTYDPTFMVGTTPRVADDLIQNGVDLETDISSVADLAGLVHYWVECDGYVIDIASDTHDHLGEILIEKNPPQYYTFSDSEQEATETLTGALARRCGYCGAQVKMCDH